MCLCKFPVSAEDRRTDGKLSQAGLSEPERTRGFVFPNAACLDPNPANKAITRTKVNLRQMVDEPMII